jgi:hypothetical protein
VPAIGFPQNISVGPNGIRDRPISPRSPWQNGYVAAFLYMYARALWGLTRNLRKPRNTAKCLPTPSLHFCYSAVKPAAPLTRHHPHDTRRSGSGLGAAPRSEFALQRQPCVRQAALEQLPTTNAVHDRLLQSMRVRFSDSEQWSSPVKPPRSQNYVKPHDARTRVRLGKFDSNSCAWPCPPYCGR